MRVLEIHHCKRWIFEKFRYRGSFEERAQKVGNKATQSIDDIREYRDENRKIFDEMRSDNNSKITALLQELGTMQKNLERLYQAREDIEKLEDRAAETLLKQFERFYDLKAQVNPSGLIPLKLEIIEMMTDLRSRGEDTSRLNQLLTKIEGVLPDSES